MNLPNMISHVVAFFGIGLLVHIAISRLSNSGNFLLKGLAIGCTCTLVFTLYISYNQELSITGIYILFSSWLLYLIILIHVINSVTLKMLAGLYKSPDGSMKNENFAKIFNAKDGFETRLSKLLSSKFIQQCGAEITLTRRAKLLMLIVHKLKTIFSII